MCIDIKDPIKGTICAPATQLVLDVLNKVLKDIKVMLLKIPESGVLVTQLKILILQLKSLANNVLEGAIRADPQEIFYQPMDSECWRKLKSHYTIVV